MRLHKSATLPHTGEKLYAADHFCKKERHDFVCLRDSGHVVRLIAFMVLNMSGRQLELVLIEDTRAVEDDTRAAMLGVAQFCEGARWSWCTLEDIAHPVVALPHPKMESYYFLLRDKHECRVWE